MGKCKGSRAHREANANPLAQDESVAEGAVLPCEEASSSLKVTVLRLDRDQDAGVAGLTVKARVSGGAALPDQTTTDAGVADFGELEPGTYATSITLSQQDALRFRPVSPVNVIVGAGQAKNRRMLIRPLVELRVIVLGYDHAAGRDLPLNRCAWELTAPLAARGTTGADGVIRVRGLLHDAAQATLKITPRRRPLRPPSRLRQAPPRPPGPYPPVIQPVHFKDRDDDPVIPTPDSNTVTWTLTLVDLAQTDGKDGARARLHNLGFLGDEGADAPAARTAVKAYQALYLGQKNGSGRLDRTLITHIKKQHDEP